MCGIFGYIGKEQAAPILIDGLKRLEYRGYDSAGIAVLNGANRVALRKRKGKVTELQQFLQSDNIHGCIGLGHTRWATHGIPNDVNSHPHTDRVGKIAIIHNGILENYLQLKTQLKKEGYSFRSETDSEVFAHLIRKHLKEGCSFRQAVLKTTKLAKGSYALGVINADEPDKIIVTRLDSPLVIGIGSGSNYISSDISALLKHTRKVITINNHELAIVKAESVEIFNDKGQSVHSKPETINWNMSDAEKLGFEHFMLKEIFEQPQIIRSILKKRIVNNQAHFEELLIKDSHLKKIKKISIVACGSSYHAGLVARYMIEKMISIPVSVEVSSEFRYRSPQLDPDTLTVLISQSGETADTLAALREAKQQKSLTLAVSNVLGSTIEREADGVIRTEAGPEIAVASTKAYTAQIAILYLFTLKLMQISGKSNVAEAKKFISAFKKTPDAMQRILDTYVADKKTWNKSVREFDKRYQAQLTKYFKSGKQIGHRAPNAFFLYLARNINYPSVMEGALKLKEIAYFSAEGYAAGEMKHGPIALIDENPWVIVVATHSDTYEKMISNIQEIKARGGMITAIISAGDTKIKKLNLYRYIEVPKVPEVFSPFLVAIPLQLIAYCVAKEFGAEIDQPRNLAKSVTVE